MMPSPPDVAGRGGGRGERKQPRGRKSLYFLALFANSGAPLPLFSRRGGGELRRWAEFASNRLVCRRGRFSFLPSSSPSSPREKGKGRKKERKAREKESLGLKNLRDNFSGRNIIKEKRGVGARGGGGEKEERKRLFAKRKGRGK